MSTIYKDYGSGGAGLTGIAGISGGSGSQRHPPIAQVLRDVADDVLAMRAEAAVARGNALVVDVAAFRTAFIVVLAKLDDDAGVTDTDYEALATPAALTAAAIVSTADLVAQLNALRVDLGVIRTAVILALAKLDDDATVNGTNYESLWTPAALTSAATIAALSEATEQINELIADRAALRTALAGIIAKLNLDSGVTDTNYVGVGAPTAGVLAPLLTIKG